MTKTKFRFGKKYTKWEGHAPTPHLWLARGYKMPLWMVQNPSEYLPMTPYTAPIFAYSKLFHEMEADAKANQN